MKWLIYGGKGWIGGQVIDILNKMEKQEIIIGSSRVDNTMAVESELKSKVPDRVLCLIGRTHGPGYSTIDYLEQKGKLVENVRDNLFSPVSLAILCQKMNIHLTYLGTGCIFTDSIPEDTDGYTEDSLPNFTGSGYSTVKGFTDRLMHMFEDSALNVRIRMPIIGESNPRNFITKISKYSKVVNIQNSMTVLPELLPIMIDLSLKKETGTINLTNPGTISHNEILDMYREYVDKEFTYENFSIEEQDCILASERSNNKLKTEKLEKMYPGVMNIKDSVKNILQNYSL
jgi:dTDP-4-dehydrorhamnose reductase